MRSLFGPAGPRWRRTASVASLALVVGALVVVAVNAEGDPITEVELNDGGVWVTNQQEGLIGRINPQIQDLDLGLQSPSVEFDVRQNAASVFTDADSGGDKSVVPIDVAKAVVGTPTSLPEKAAIAYNDGIFAMRDIKNGRVWVQDERLLVPVTAKSQDFVAEGAVAATVAADGTAYWVDADGVISTVSIDATGQQNTAEVADLGTQLGAESEITVVGDTPVVLDLAGTGRLLLPQSAPIELHDDNLAHLHLQQPSAAAGYVVLATHTDVFRVPLSGGERESLRNELGLPGPVAGEPAPPVVLGECVYAAWADPQPGSANYLRDCPGASADDAEALEGSIEPGADFQFRVNRRIVVLNDTYSGDSWLVQQPGHKKISDWDSVNPEKQNKPTQDQVTDEVEREDNRPPEATDDDVAARPDKATILPIVAMNDHDADGDIITIKKVQPISGPDVEPKIISSGTQLQVTLRGTEPGLVRLKYTVTDGNGGEDTAEVRLTVLRNDARNRKPQLMPDREPRLTVARGRASSIYLTADYVDPDGDDLVLTDAQSSGGDVEFRPDGTIQFTDNGDGNRSKVVSFTIEDGHGETLEGKLPVDVLDGQGVKPQLVPDLKSGVANTRVLVQPLLNDRNPEGGDLLLEKVKVRGDATGTKVDYDAKTGTFVFSAEQARSYYLDYSAASPSGASASSFVRFDVESPPKNNRPPVAVADKAVLSPGEATQADLLLNDIDDDGDVLVVTQVGQPSIPGVKVSVVDKRVAVISSSADLAGKAATVSYTVSDGRNTAVGSLTVSQRTATENRSPVANKDQITAREGSVATVSVLDNDSDADGGKLQLTYVDPVAGTDGSTLKDIWISDDVIRFKAPRLTDGKPKVYKAIYGVADPDGLRSDAEIMVFVIPDSAANNHPPAPAPIIERAIAGRPKVIEVDMAGADPDGDAVSFTRIISAPKRGRIVDTGADWIRYEAYEGRTGTDFFQIEVRDKYGAVGVAAVRVGVVPRLTVNQAPVALDDRIVVQPDRPVTYYVLGNDVDPDDDRLRIGEELDAAKELDARQAAGFVSLVVPKLEDGKPSTSTVGYELLDDAQESDHATLRVEAREDAPLYAPIARDDVVELGKIAGRSAGTFIEVDPLANDLDIDGSPDELRLLGCNADTPDGCQRAGQKLKVRLTAQDQTVVYDLGDGDKESLDTSGVVFVRGTENIPPTVNSGAVPLVTKAGVPLKIDIRRVIVTRPDRRPSISASITPEAINGRIELDPEVATGMVFTPGREHVGPASVSVAVSDSRGGDDPDALESIVTIPIDVEPATNEPPAVRGADVQVAADGEVELDLAGLVQDVNPKYEPDEMEYAVVSEEGALAASLSESILTITATGAEESGTGSVVFRVDDREGGTANGTVSVAIAATARELASVTTTEIKADKGERVTVDIAPNSHNPYRDEGKPLRVHDSFAVEGASQSAIAEFEAKGSTVSFVPVGTGLITVKLTVSDASGDPKRDVVGRIKVAVADAPDAPSRPEVSSVQAHSVVLSWREPNNNGSPITAYHVRGSNGFETTCPATTCALEGLEPGEKYSFEVAAENAADMGDWSSRSETVTPNEIPDIMSPPVIDPDPTARDGQLRLTWTAPNNEGDEIENYVIKWNGGSKSVPADTSAVISPLENGVSYRFSIYAVNSAGPGSESASSAAETPYGKPDPVDQPVATATETSASPTVALSWNPPDDNGDDITGYVVTCTGCAQRSYTLRGIGTSKVFGGSEGIENGKTYSFQVAAVNRAGEGRPGVAASAMPFKPADAVSGLRDLGSPADRVAKVTWNTPDMGGLDFRYYVIEGAGLIGPQRIDMRDVPSGGIQLTFSDNGEHNVSVRAVTQKGSDGLIEGKSAGTSAATWGAPGAPSAVSRAQTDYYRVALGVAPGSENGKKVTGLQINRGGSWVNADTTEQLDAQYGGESQCAKFRTVSAADDARKYSAETQVCGSSLMRTLRLDKAEAVSLTVAGDIGCVASSPSGGEGEGPGEGESPSPTAEPVVCVDGNRIAIEGAGFPKNARLALDLKPASSPFASCPSETTVNGDGSVSLRPETCWFPQSDIVVATIFDTNDSW